MSQGVIVGVREEDEGFVEEEVVVVAGVGVDEEAGVEVMAVGCFELPDAPVPVPVLGLFEVEPEFEPEAGLSNGLTLLLMYEFVLVNIHCLISFFAYKIEKSMVACFAGYVAVQFYYYSIVQIIFMFESILLFVYICVYM